MQAGIKSSVEAYSFEAGPEPAPSPWSGYREIGASDEPADRPSSAQMEQRMVEEARLSFETGRQRGLLEGRQNEQVAQADARAAEEKERTEKATTLLRVFAEASDSYLRAIEQEVVELALAVAARILRREAQMDPLLLTGAVRVALGQLSKTSQACLRVPETELSLARGHRASAQSCFRGPPGCRRADAAGRLCT